MNRGELVQAMSDILSWEAPGDDVWQARCRRFIDQAYFRVVSEVPEALVPDELRVRLPGTYASGGGSAITSFISTTADPFVLAFTTSAGSTFNPSINGIWDGVYWLEITRPDGTVWRGQCREFWEEIGGGVKSRYVSIDRPYTDVALVNAPYRLSPNYLWLPDNIIRVVGGQRFGSTGEPLSLETLTSAIWHDEWSNQNSREYNYPRRLRAEKAYQLPSPNITPTVTQGGEQGGPAIWGPEPWGSFDYCFTYIWGYRDPMQESMSGSLIPLFESAPSPASAKQSVTSASVDIVVGLPDVAWELNYGDNTTLRYSHSGWKKRLYRRRYTVTGGTHTSIEHPEVFQFLADVDDVATSFTDKGDHPPDYFVRLPEVHGYRAWSPWPLPGGEEWTEYQLVVQRQAEKLLNDSDSPRIAAQVQDALTFYAVAYLARHDKNEAVANDYEVRAQGLVAKFRRDVANPVGHVAREGWDSSGRSGGWPRARNI